MAKTSSVPHPGLVLVSEYLEPHDLTQYRLARDCGVPPRRINEIVLGRRGISADTALRLARYFGNEPRDWLELQQRFELQEARRALGQRLDTEVVPLGQGGPRRRRGRPAKTTATKAVAVTAAAVAPPERPRQRRAALEDHLL